MTTPSWIVFDIEGTLVDSVHRTLTCWKDTLRDFGITFSTATLQAYSGMDGDDMLRILVPALDESKRKDILESQSKRYQQEHLPLIEPFEDAKEVLEWLRSEDYRIAVATDCKGPPLSRYRTILSLDAYLDVLACGEDVTEGKPDGGLLKRVLHDAKAKPDAAIMIGDTPYDAVAATAAGMKCYGVLTGGFSDTDLMKAGCTETLERLGQLLERLKHPN